MFYKKIIVERIREIRVIGDLKYELWRDYTNGNHMMVTHEPYNIKGVTFDMVEIREIFPEVYMEDAL